MKLQNYTQAREAAVIALWNKALPGDAITLGQFRQQVLFDENFDPALCQVAVEGTEVIGFALGIKRKFPYMERGLEPDRGWISVIFVHPGHRRRGVGEALVCRTEALLRARGARNITLGAYSPGYFFPGIDAEQYPQAGPFFEGLGYQPGGVAYSMEKLLRGFKPDMEKRRRAEDRGFRFVAFDHCHTLEILNFAGEAFGGGWKRNVLMCLREGRAEDCLLLALDRGGDVVGFCMRQIDGNPSRFGPIGVAEEARCEGIGSILFEKMEEEMLRRRIFYLYFLTTEEKGRRFYERHGLRVCRCYRHYEKEL